MTDLAAVKAAARKAAFAVRKPLFAAANAAQAGHLSAVLAGSGARFLALPLQS